MQRYLNSQTLILGGCSLIVFYLAVLPIGTLLYGSFRSAPVMVPGAFFFIQNYISAISDLEAYSLAWNSFQFGLGSSIRFYHRNLFGMGQ